MESESEHPAVPDRRQREYEKLDRYRVLARELEQTAQELEGTRDAGDLKAAAVTLRDQCAAIVRRLGREVKQDEEGVEAGAQAPR